MTIFLYGLTFLVGTLLVGGGLLLLVDHFNSRHDPTRPTRVPGPAKTKTTKRRTGTGSWSVHLRVTASPRRECLLVWHRDSEATATAGFLVGHGECLRGEVSLWKAEVSEPIFLMPADSGCAVLVDHQPGTRHRRLRLVDVGGIVRNTFLLGGQVLEQGWSQDGLHYWCVLGDDQKGDEQACTFHLYSVDAGDCLLQANDPRGEMGADAKGEIEAVTVADHAVEIRMAAGGTTRLSLRQSGRLPVMPVVRPEPAA